MEMSPFASPLILGVVLIVLGSIDIVLTVKVSWRMLVLHRDEAIDLGHWVWHIAFPLLAGTLYVCTAIGLLIGLQLALVGMSMADLLCLTIGLHNTWALTIWLILHREGFHHTQDEQQITKSDAILQ